eukprot:5741198-Prorocentrum_lima.AAC.1
MSMIWSGCIVGLVPLPFGLPCGGSGLFCSWFTASPAVASNVARINVRMRVVRPGRFLAVRELLAFVLSS